MSKHARVHLADNSVVHCSRVWELCDALGVPAIARSSSQSVHPEDPLSAVDVPAMADRAGAAWYRRRGVYVIGHQLGTVRDRRHTLGDRYLGVDG